MARLRLWVAAILLGAVTMGAAPARADIDFSITAACAGTWAVVSSANFETVKVCKRSAPVVAVHRGRGPRTLASRPRFVMRHVRIVRREPVILDRLAFAVVLGTRECTSLLCPQFLLTGVGF